MLHCPQTNVLWYMVFWLLSTMWILHADDPSKKPKRIVDVGCGIGGSSRYLAKKYGAKCQGITLSPVQAQRAQDLAMVEGLAEDVCKSSPLSLFSTCCCIITNLQYVVEQQLPFSAYFLSRRMFFLYI